MSRILLTLLTLLAVARPGLAEIQPGVLRLTLPKEIYAVVDSEMNVYFDNIVLTESPETYRFSFQCDVGKTDSRRWNLTAKSADVGAHSLAVTVSDADGKKLGTATTRLHVVAKDAGTGGSVKLLIVGDSLTHATAYPNEVARLLSSPGNPKWKMLGTHRPTSAADGVAHEGYGGWTWQRFVTKYEPNPDGTHRKRSSPFVFLNKSEKPELDVAEYFRTTSDGQRPDVVFFLLGINDCFGADPDDAASIDARIDSMMAQAEILIAEFRKAAPNADLAVCVTTPPNTRESGFEANYKGRYHRWGWKRIQHRLVERLLTRFEKQKGEATNRDNKLFVVPTHLNLDPTNGYPENNGVHPNAFGYRQIGSSLYAWLKWRQAQSLSLRSPISTD
jgi:lysophospholipase L1-like esterase